ncbi:E3 ubiquitin-protein ligase Topors-like [Panonychus citri]|uniref:E3 ubiquitin-protein ligase Topors-like n=1 Tax=Panonychus citri TaxID=50023 RepID=UPI0023072E31|nr:E3 ubiquitin-protein ligase Topors-like [Panonychus citri]
MPSNDDDDKEQKSKSDRQSTNQHSNNSEKENNSKLDDEKSNENNQQIGNDESQCYICLTTRINPCYADNCLHQFCTNCLLEWSKSSDQCPVCRTTFENLIINVKSDSDYETIPIQPNPPMGQQQLALENLLDLIISEITRSIPEANSNPENDRRSSIPEASPNRERVNPEATNNTRNSSNRVCEIPNRRESETTVRTENENLHRWRRVSKDRRRKRRPRLISKSNETQNPNISSSPSPSGSPTPPEVNSDEKKVTTSESDNNRPSSSSSPANRQEPVKTDQNKNSNRVHNRKHQLSEKKSPSRNKRKRD